MMVINRDEQTTKLNWSDTFLEMYIFMAEHCKDEQKQQPMLRTPFDFFPYKQFEK